MNAKASFFRSKIGRKQIVAVTGLGLSGFVLIHMLGNLSILFSAQKYNEYGHALVSNPLLIFAEFGLIAMFLAHVSMAMKLTIENFGARPQRYAVSPCGAKATDPVSRSMWAQGAVILVFVVVHLINFKWGTVYTVDYGHGPIRDLHRLVVEAFRQPEYVAGYLVALLALGFHLSHGLKSTLQTLGLHHPSHQGKVKCLSWLYATVVAVGFMSQPIYVYFFHKG